MVITDSSAGNGILVKAGELVRKSFRGPRERAVGGRRRDRARDARPFSFGQPDAVDCRL